jgi:hypothetical protein
MRDIVWYSTQCLSFLTFAVLYQKTIGRFGTWDLDRSKYSSTATCLSMCSSNRICMALGLQTLDIGVDQRDLQQGVPNETHMDASGKVCYIMYSDSNRLSNTGYRVPHPSSKLILLEMYYISFTVFNRVDSCSAVINSRKASPLISAFISWIISGSISNEQSEPAFHFSGRAKASFRDMPDGPGLSLSQRIRTPWRKSMKDCSYFRRRVGHIHGQSVLQNDQHLPKMGNIDLNRLDCRSRSYHRFFRVHVHSLPCD